MGDTLRQDWPYCLKVVQRCEGDESGMDEDFLAFATYVRGAIEARSRVEASANMEEQDMQGYVDDDAPYEESPDIPISRFEVIAGKYAGCTFAEVYEDDQEYCDWLVDHMMKSRDAGSQIWPLVAYILYRRQLAS